MEYRITKGYKSNDSLFLLIGQSNAAGRGFFDEAEPLDTCKDKLKVLRNGRWQTMYRPGNPDRPFSGTCLAESFAKAYSDAHYDVEVGIIPCADGGTTLEQWQPGGLLFDNAVNCTKLAMRTSHLVGVLWHQGEGDCRSERYPLYQERFTAIMNKLRKQLEMPNLPILIGGLGDFLLNCTLSENLQNYYHINRALKKIAEEDPNCAYVSAEGLEANPDNLHFNAAALKKFGIRYFNAYQKLDSYDVNSYNEPKEKDDNRTKMELL